MKYGLTSKDMTLIQNACRLFPHIASVVLFGSRAMGNFKNGSDVDLALKGNLESSTVNQLKQRLAEETTMPYFFDIVHYESVEKKAFKDHIDHYGIEIYQRGKK